jgi:hypothetical protein
LLRLTAVQQVEGGVVPPVRHRHLQSLVPKVVSKRCYRGVKVMLQLYDIGVIIVS